MSLIMEKFAYGIFVLLFLRALWCFIFVMIHLARLKDAWQKTTGKRMPLLLHISPFALYVSEVPGACRIHKKRYFDSIRSFQLALLCGLVVVVISSIFHQRFGAAS